MNKFVRLFEEVSASLAETGARSLCIPLQAAQALTSAHIGAMARSCLGLDSCSFNTGLMFKNNKLVFISSLYDKRCDRAT